MKSIAVSLIESIDKIYEDMRMNEASSLEFTEYLMNSETSSDEVFEYCYRLTREFVNSLNLQPAPSNLRYPPINLELYHTTKMRPESYAESDLAKLIVGVDVRQNNEPGLYYFFNSNKLDPDLIKKMYSIIDFAKLAMDKYGVVLSNVPRKLSTKNTDLFYVGDGSKLKRFNDDDYVNLITINVNISTSYPSCIRVEFYPTHNRVGNLKQVDFSVFRESVEDELNTWFKETSKIYHDGINGYKDYRDPNKKYTKKASNAVYKAFLKVYLEQFGSERGIIRNRFLGAAKSQENINTAFRIIDTILRNGLESEIDYVDPFEYTYSELTKDSKNGKIGILGYNGGYIKGCDEMQNLLEKIAEESKR